MLGYFQNVLGDSHGLVLGPRVRTLPQQSEP